MQVFLVFDQERNPLFSGYAAVNVLLPPQVDPYSDPSMSLYLDLYGDNEQNSHMGVAEIHLDEIAERHSKEGAFVISEAKIVDLFWKANEPLDNRKSAILIHSMLLSEWTVQIKQDAARYTESIYLEKDLYEFIKSRLSENDN